MTTRKSLLPPLFPLPPAHRGHGGRAGLERRAQLRDPPHDGGRALAGQGGTQELGELIYHLLPAHTLLPPLRLRLRQLHPPLLPPPRPRGQPA